MAAAANSLRLCVRAHGRISRLTTASRSVSLARRALSTTPARHAVKETPNEDDDEATNKRFATVGEALKDLVKSGEYGGEAARMSEIYEGLSAEEREKMEKLTKEVIQETAAAKRPVAYNKKIAFWNENEPDTDLITNEVGEDEFDENDITSMAHGKLEEHREYREYARIAIWEMPLLSKFAKPFRPPQGDEVLRFRYTTYMGELHPADKKVVVEFSPADLKDLTDVQRLKLKKLAGARYNPEKDIIKMSCERFEYQAQNKRYLGDLVNDMIKAAKDPTDTFEDIPLDLRHHKFKVKHKFPKEWLMTEERKKEIEAERQRAYLMDQQKRANGGLVDGLQKIKELQSPPPVRERVPVRMMR